MMIICLFFLLLSLPSSRCRQCARCYYSSIDALVTTIIIYKCILHSSAHRQTEDRRQHASNNAFYRRANASIQMCSDSIKCFSFRFSLILIPLLLRLVRSFFDYVFFLVAYLNGSRVCARARARIDNDNVIILLLKESLGNCSVTTSLAHFYFAYCSDNEKSSQAIVCDFSLRIHSSSASSSLTTVAVHLGMPKRFIFLRFSNSTESSPLLRLCFGARQSNRL